MGKAAKDVMRLREEERAALQDLLGKPRVAAAQAGRARMVLKAEVDGPGWPAPTIAVACEVGVSPLHRRRQRRGEDGLGAA